MEFLILVVLIGLIPAMIARSKGRQFVVWWLYGSLIFIVALPHALLLKPEIKQLEQQQAAQGLKKCPFCAEMIKPDAKVCRYCSRDLPAAEPAVSGLGPPPATSVVAPDVAADNPSGAPEESEQQRRDRLRAQLDEFRKQSPPRDR
ncbi:MAG: hypothetical protein ACHQ7H_01015 [Candidatus Rokuibacteriota bacterium]|jgi:hypothetical protein